MDFRLEGAYCTEIGANFANNKLVIIPKVVQELTRQRVLVEEFVEGIRIDRLQASQVNVHQIVQTLIELYVQMNGARLAGYEMWQRRAGLQPARDRDAANYQRRIRDG